MGQQQVHSQKFVLGGINFWGEVYEGRSINSRTVILIKHRANTEYRNYSQVVPALMYTTYHGFIYDVMQ